MNWQLTKKVDNVRGERTLNPISLRRCKYGCCQLPERSEELPTVNFNGYKN